MSAVSHKVKLDVQMDPEILEKLRAMARKEGRRPQSLVDEALREYMADGEPLAPRRHVEAALAYSTLKRTMHFTRNRRSDVIVFQCFILRQPAPNEV